jgi:capsular polysaccharide export protein
MIPARRFLFLQGPPGLFWVRFAEALEAAGHRTLRVNLNLGDRAFWPKRGALDYRGGFAGWRPWLDALLAREGITDILYYADRLPYHVAALAAAKARGLRVHAIEFGYLRPDWIAVEPEALGRRSTFPRDPEAVRALARGQPEPDMVPRFPYPFLQEAAREVSYNLLMVFGRAFYPFYRSDKYYWPVAEYLAWLVRLAGRTVLAARDEAMVDRCLAGDFPYNIVAMQLQMDYQIRASSDYRHLEDMLDEVMASLAAHAPPDRHLVLKLHPLDCGLEFWPWRVGRLVRRHGLGGRVHLLDSKRLSPLVKGSRGVILVNSTVGPGALGDGVPVIALGDAIYDMPGLTHQAGLDRFWCAPERPDPALVADLRRALAAHFHVRGSFYDPDGQRAAIAALVTKLGA